MPGLKFNVTSQNVTFGLINTSTGAAITGATCSAFVSKDGAAQANGGGTFTELGHGSYNYAPTQAETSATAVTFLFSATNAVIQNEQFFTDQVDANNLVKVDVEDWNGTAVSVPATAGIPDVNTKNFNNHAAQTDGNNLPKVDVEDWNATAVSVPATAGIVDINVKNWNNHAALSDANNFPEVDVEDWKGSAVNALVSGKIDALTNIHTGTAQAGSAGSITLDSGANATNGYYKGEYVLILSGTGVGQVRPIIAYVGATKVATVTPGWSTNPDNTSVFALIPACLVDVVAWLETGVSGVTAGIPDVNTKNYNNQTAQTDGNNLPIVDIGDIAGAAVSTSAAQLGVNVVQYNSQTAQTDGNGLPKVDLVDIAGAAVNTAAAQLGVNTVNLGGHAVALDANNLLEVDVEDVGGVALATHAAGMVPADVRDIVGAAVNTAAAQIGANAVNIAGQAAQLDGNNLLKVDVEDINGNAGAAQNVAKANEVIGRGTVSSGANTSTVPTAAWSLGGASVVSGQFIGRTIIFDSGTTTGALAGQATAITNNTSGATPVFTVSALTTPPVNGDTFGVY